MEGYGAGKLLEPHRVGALHVRVVLGLWGCFHKCNGAAMKLMKSLGLCTKGPGHQWYEHDRLALQNILVWAPGPQVQCF